MRPPMSAAPSRGKCPIALRSKFVEWNSVRVILKRPTHVGNHVYQQLMNIRPAQVIAFIGFRIEWLRLPLMDMDKEIHTFILSIAFHTMHDGCKCHVILFEPDTYLFFGFPSGCSHHGFAA